MSQCPPRRSLYFQYKHYTPLLTGLSLEWNPPAHKSEISHISSRFGQNRTQPNFSNQRDPAWSRALALARENTINWRSNIMFSPASDLCICHSRFSVATTASPTAITRIPENGFLWFWGREHLITIEYELYSRITSCVTINTWYRI